MRLRRARPPKARASRLTGDENKLGSFLLVRHRTSTFTTTAGLFFVHAFATSVSVLTPSLLLAAGHIFFATVLHIATRGRIIVLRGFEGKCRSRNSQGRAASKDENKCFEFLHLYVSGSKNC
jgi:hypothetical protein